MTCLIKQTPVDSPPVSFHEAFLLSTPGGDIEIFSELYQMDLGKTKVDDLVAKGRLWVLTIFMKDQCPRFGPGLFNRSKTYGTQTATVHRIRDKFYTEPEHYFVVRSDDLSEVCEDFLEDVKLVPSNGFGKFFPKHPQHAFLQGGDYASTEIIDDETKAEVNSGFRDWFHYNTFVGYGNIMITRMS